MLLPILLKPNAKQTQLISFKDGLVTVKISSPPIDNKANKALIEYLADLLNLPKSLITLKSGHTSRSKHIEIDAPIGHVHAKLQAELDKQPKQSTLL